MNVKTIYNKNMESFGDRYQDIREFLSGESKTAHDYTLPEGIIVGTEVISGRKLLLAAREEQQYQLDFMYASDKLLEIWFNQFENRNFRSRYILFGFGNGMFVDKLLKEVEEKADIIVVEPSVAIFRTVLEEFDISHILSNKHVHLVLEGISEKSMLDVLREYLEYDDLPGAMIWTYFNYGELFPEEKQQFDSTVKFICTSIEASHTVIERMGWRYYRNSMLNFPYMLNAKSLIALNQKLPKNIPAFIVSSGPSLEKNIDELKKAKNRGFIVAADSAAGALLNRGIVPDLMMTIDAFKSEKHFHSSDICKVPLVCSLHCNWDLLKLHEGDKYFINDHNTYVDRYYRNIQKKFLPLSGGGSVATSIFALLEQLQFKTFILVGQDLAFLGERLYAADTVRGNDNLNPEETSTVYIEGIDGEQVLSSYEFKIYLNWFEEEIQMNQEIRVIDATEGGAKIYGAKLQTLAETIEKECGEEVDIAGIMQSIPNRLSEYEQKNFFEYINDLPNVMHRIQDMVAVQMRNISQMERLIKKGEEVTKKMQTLLKKTGKLGQEIEDVDAFYYLNNYIQQYLKDDFVGDMYHSKGSKTDEVRVSVLQLKKYYCVMDKYLPELIDDIEKKIQLKSAKLFYEQ